MGDPEAIAAELQAIIDGPPKATVREFAGHLGKLALHFWRPDFTPDQAKLMYRDFVHDLDGVTAQELAGACEAWRTDSRNSFYPTPGKLLDLVKDALGDRARARTGAEYLLTLLASDKPVAGTGRAFNPAEALRKLGDEMRVKSGATRVSDQVEEVIVPRLNTARPATDAAELLDHLKKRTGT